MNNELCIYNILSAHTIGCRLKLLENLKSIIHILNENISHNKQSYLTFLIKYLFSTTKDNPSVTNVNLKKYNNSFNNLSLLNKIYNLSSNWYYDILDSSDIIYIHKIQYLLSKLNS